MLKRIIFGVIAAAILILALYLGGWVLQVLAAVAFTICMVECGNAFKKAGNKPVIWPAIVFAAAVSPLIYILDGSLEAGMLFYGLMVMIALCAQLFRSENSLANIMASLYPFAYPGIPILFFAAMLKGIAEPNHMMALLILLACSIMTDIFAFFTGISIGRHKLCPGISPNKTVEGAVGGLIGAVLTGLALAFWIQPLFGGTIWFADYIVLAVLCGVFSQGGDLSASLLKRMAGIKDFGHIIPGHGGVMDRLDSIIFCAPIVYCYIYFMGF